jgi:hypothetical protein
MRFIRLEFISAFLIFLSILSVQAAPGPRRPKKPEAGNRDFRVTADVLLCRVAMTPLPAPIKDIKARYRRGQVVTATCRHLLEDFE